MRRTLLGSVVAIAGIAAASGVGIAAAGATRKATFDGTCHLTGTSTFSPNLTGTQRKIHYSFHSGAPAKGTPNQTTCSGTLNGKTISNRKAVASVAGVGKLSCAMGTSTSPGHGTLRIGANTFKFAFTFTATATEVDYTTDNSKYGGGKATGHASFAKYAPKNSAALCGPKGKGIHRLGFEANDNAPNKPFVGTRSTH